MDPVISILAALLMHEHVARCTSDVSHLALAVTGFQSFSFSTPQSRRRHVMKLSFPIRPSYDSAVISGKGRRLCLSQQVTYRHPFHGRSINPPQDSAPSIRFFSESFHSLYLTFMRKFLYEFKVFRALVTHSTAAFNLGC